MSGEIHLGYEVGTGKAIAIPCLNLAIAGQTQQSGKTTTLEALAARAGDRRVLAFVTKRGEGAFSTGRRITPYFRDRADWQFVSSIIDATLQEKNKFLRPWIMRICRKTHSLAEVHEAVIDALRTAKGIHEGVYTQLDEYLRLIVPEIERAELASTLDLRPGLNVMDVSAAPLAMQMLYVQSALDFVNAKLRDTIVVIPEAWEFVPNGKSSPVTASAIALTRKGSGIGNHIWVDSQDLAAVHMEIRRGCQVYLLGVQRETNEIKRNLELIPKSLDRPEADAVALLGKGQFFACWGHELRRVYVQPAWMDEATAKSAAITGQVAAGAAPQRPPAAPAKENPGMCEEHQRNAAEVTRLTGRVSALETDNRMLAERASEGDEARRMLGIIRDGFAALGLGGGGGTPVDLERLVDVVTARVLARVPASGAVIHVTPPEKLRADFQREAVARVLADVGNMSTLAKIVLKFLESTGGRFRNGAIAKGIGRPNNGDLSKALKEGIDLGLLHADKHGNGVQTNVRERLTEMLDVYQPAAGDVEATYQRVLHELAAEGAERAA